MLAPVVRACGMAVTPSSSFPGSSNRTWPSSNLLLKLPEISYKPSSITALPPSMGIAERKLLEGPGTKFRYWKCGSIGITCSRITHTESGKDAFTCGDGEVDTMECSCARRD